MAFTHLHVHSTYSLLEASCTVDQLVEKAVSQGCGALALTDENHCAGLFEFYQACNKKKIKPILGMQINVTSDMRLQQGDEVNKSVILLVKNKVGWKNLCILSSEAYITGFYYTPRIDYALLQKHSEGLILLTGGFDGHLANHILYNRLEKAKLLLQWYKKTFGEDVYVEVMLHPSPNKPVAEKMEKQVCEVSLKLADEVGIKCVCTNDVRYSNNSRSEINTQDILNCVKYHKVVTDDTRKCLPSYEYYMKTREELESLFPIRDDLFDNTIEIANKIENNIIETGMDLLPVFKTPDGSDPSVYLRNLVYDGLKKKDLFEKQEYRDRADWELRVFETCGFVNYFLVLYEFVNWAREQSISLGPGRGSAAGSLCLYSLGVTKLDPIEFGLLFERFFSVDTKYVLHSSMFGFSFATPNIEIPKNLPQKLFERAKIHPEFNEARFNSEGKKMKQMGCLNDFMRIFYEFSEGKMEPGSLNDCDSVLAFYSGMTTSRPTNQFSPKEELIAARVSPPDVDLDFDYHRRDEIFIHLQEKYGKDRVAHIGTSGGFKGKQSIKDVGKASNIRERWKKTQNDKSLENETEEEKKKKTLEMVERMADLAGPGMTFKEAYDDNPELRKCIDTTDIMYDVCCQFDGLVRQFGIHAAGTVLCNRDLREIIPLRCDDKKMICTQWDKDQVEALGLCKYDLLGLINVSIIDQTLKMIKERKGIDIDLDVLKPNDQNLFKMLSEGKTAGIFQFETRGATEIVKMIGIKEFKDLVACNAINRPGPGREVAEAYSDRKHGRKEVELLHPLMKDVVSETYGLLIYQEQIMNLSRVMASFTRSEADKLRKCVTDDTMFVSKIRGWISIKKLLQEGYKDDLFLTMDEFGCQKWSKIKDIWCTGKHNVHTVKSKSGFFVNATQYHQFLTDDGWKARMRLTDNDSLIVAKKIHYDGVDTISKNMTIIIAGMLTEGYFVKKHSTFTSFDKEFMDFYVKCFREEFGDVGILYKGERVFAIHQNERLKIHKYIDFSLSKDKKIPDCMMGMTYETTKNFLSFMFGAECGISYSSGQIEYSSKSIKIINQIKLLLLRFGISSLFSVKKHKKYGNFYRLYINNLSDQKIFLSLLTDNFPKRKKEDLIRVIEKKDDKNFSSDSIPQKIVKRFMDQYPFVGNGESGSIYKIKITRPRFSRMCEISKDKKWISLSNGYHLYDKIKSVNEVFSKSIETYDFSMENEDEPYIIANGMVIHNSIGKKKIELLDALREKFVAGCVENGIDKATAIDVWQLIYKFGGYGFNLCLSGDTLVFNKVDDRYYALEDLCNELPKSGVTLDSYLNGNIVDDKVEKVFETGEKEIFEIELDNSMIIKCTMDHKFYCSDGKEYIVREIIEKNLEILFDEKESDKSMKLCKIKSVKSLGFQKTYNVTMKSLQHNYRIVNNSGLGIYSKNSHSAAYAYLAYQEAYLKYYYPVEFFCALFSSVIGDAEKFEQYKMEAVGDDRLGIKGLGVKLWPVHINKSRDQYYIDNNGLRLPLTIVDKVGESAVREIMRGQPYTDFEDFVNRVDSRAVNIAVVKNLARVKYGAFSCFGIKEKEAEQKFEMMKKDISRRKISKNRFVQDNVLKGINLLANRKNSSY